MHSSLNLVANSAAFITASILFHPPNCSSAILSGLIYTQSSIHSCFKICDVNDVFPEPFGPAITIYFGLISSI